MKKMTKLLALLLALAMIFSLAACSNTPENPPATDDKANANTTEAAANHEPDKDSEPAPETEAPATEAPGTEAPATDAPATELPATEAPATDAPETTASPVEPDDSPIFGRYEGEISMDLMLQVNGAGMEEEDADLYARLFEGCGSMVLYMEFSTGQRIHVGMDKESVGKVLDQMLENMPEILPEMMGMSMEEMEETLNAQGVSMDDFMAMMREELNPEELFGAGNMSMLGTYRLDGDKLIITEEGEEEDPDEYMVIELEDDSLTIVDVIDGEESASEGGEENPLNTLLPWVLHKTSDTPLTSFDPEPEEPTDDTEPSVDVGSAAGTYRLIRATTMGTSMDPATLGMTMVFTLNEDGTGKAMTMIEDEKDEAELSWQQEGSAVHLIVDGEAEEAVFDGSTLTIGIEDDSIELILERQ